MKTIMRQPATRHALSPLALCAVLALSACGGGGGTDDAAASETSPRVTASLADSFPTGLAVASPGDVSGTVAVSAAPQPAGLRVALDWARATWAALREGDGAQLARLATLALPVATARADGTGAPELSAHADALEKILSADTSVTLADLLDLAGLFGMADAHAACYGPQVLYASHDDGGGTAAGQLPSGDVGLWLANEAPGRPCAVAQMGKRVRGVKHQTLQGLLLAAVMRQTVAASSTLAMPAAGGSTDLATELAARLAGLPAAAGVGVAAASIALDGAGQYTYRLVLTHGSGASARRGEVILRHTPGADARHYSGTLQVAGFTLDSDVAFGCSDEVDSASGRFKVARLSTVAYSRADAAIGFGARSAHYCGHPVAGTGSDDGAQVAGLTADHQLDPAVKLSGSTRGAATGWRGNFTRYAGDFDRSTAAGSFLMAWQAGPGDSHSRALAARATVNSATGDRTLDGWFAYAGDLASSTGALQGMICNWAGPGHSHATNTRFQSQTATRAAAATAWTLGSSKITYAPTVSCNSVTTQFDVDANGTLDAGEGLGTSANLDGLTGGRTSVDSELASRGYSQPTRF